MGEGAVATPPPAQSPNLAAEVMARRDSQALAKLMRERRELDSRARQLEEVAPAASAVAKAKQYAEEGDHARALEALLGSVYGDKAKEALPTIYQSLTAQVLGTESPQVAQKRLEHETARLRREHDALVQQWEADKAAYSEWATAQQEARIQEGIRSLDTVLQGKATEYPYLMAEASDPGQMVWDIMVAAIERGEDPPEPEVAAKIANEYFQPIVEQKKTRYQNLLAPQGANGSTQHASPPSQPAGQRMSLTNADAAVAPDLKAPKTMLSREDSIEQAHRLLRERHRQT